MYSENENKNKSKMITTSLVIWHVFALLQICCWNYHSIGLVQAFVPYDHHRSSSAITSKVSIPIYQHVSIKSNDKSITSRSSLDSFRLQNFWKKAHRFNKNNNNRNNIIISMSSSSSQAAERQHYSRSNNINLIQGMTIIDNTVDVLHDKLAHLCESSLYFRLYSVDILGSCEYMSQELSECYAERCEIYPEDDDMIPQKLISLDQQDGNELLELDTWSRWDMPSNDYYDTQTFTEGYTGYDGSSIWKKIHDTIAFPIVPSNDNTNNNWKNDFNKILSGLHSLISAQVTRGIHEKIINGEEFGIDDIWTDPSNEYRRRLSPYGETPLALENLYYTCMVLISAINIVKDTYIVEYNSRHIDDDTNILNDILGMSLFTDTSVNVPAMTIQQHTTTTTMYNTNNDLWQARMRSRDLLRIMNCVQCNKCRFHGKISTMGIITAMKIIIGSNNNNNNNNNIHTKLTRVELSTLLTTLYKCTSAIQFCKEMEQQIS